MPDSPTQAMLNALDALDVEAFTSLFVSTGRLMLTNGSVAEGTEQVRAAISAFISELRATTHKITAEWHPEDGVWIAEMQATYELRDHGLRGPYSRATVLRGGPDGIADLRVYGRHELPLTEPEHHYQEVFAGGRWLATL
jgi:hypothetical protein